MRVRNRTEKVNRMPGVRLMYDLLSQPCRAVVMFLDANKIPYESVVVKIAEGNYSYVFLICGWFRALITA